MSTVNHFQIRKTLIHFARFKPAWPQNHNGFLGEVPCCKSHEFPKRLRVKTRSLYIFFAIRSMITLYFDNFRGRRVHPPPRIRHWLQFIIYSREKQQITKIKWIFRKKRDHPYVNYGRRCKRAKKIKLLIQM